MNEELIFFSPFFYLKKKKKYQGSLSKAFGFATGSSSSKSKRNEAKLGSSTSPTPSYTSLSSENGLYASVGVIPPPLPCNGPPNMLPYHQQSQQSHYQRSPFAQLQQQQQQSASHYRSSYASPPSGSGSSSSPPPPVPNHRVSAPPMDTNNMNSTLPRYAQSQHRRVKSISDIEALAVTP